MKVTGILQLVLNFALSFLRSGKLAESQRDYLKLELIRWLSSTYRTVTKRKNPELGIAINVCSTDRSANIDEYWSDHTVNSAAFSTKWESNKYYEWLLRDYPLLAEFMDFNQNRSDQVILDYGCGPGNDIFRFLIVNSAKKVTGIDVSYKALELARERLALYQIAPERLDLIQCSDSSASLPVESQSIDYVNCAGVLHHTSQPERLLSEFYRVLKSNSSGNIMVYNQDSVFFHLHVAYQTVIIENRFPGMTEKGVFSRCTDGEKCPVSRCYKGVEFMEICSNAGFDVEFLGGYFNRMELAWLEKLGKNALADERLSNEHKDFLRKLEYDRKGYPMYEGKHAGIGGVYKVHKR